MTPTNQPTYTLTDPDKMPPKHVVRLACSYAYAIGEATRRAIVEGKPTLVTRDGDAVVALYKPSTTVTGRRSYTVSRPARPVKA